MFETGERSLELLGVCQGVKAVRGSEVLRVGVGYGERHEEKYISRNKI